MSLANSQELLAHDGHYPIVSSPGLRVIIDCLCHHLRGIKKKSSVNQFIIIKFHDVGMTGLERKESGANEIVEDDLLDAED
jgi:hypothetical protein